MQLVCLASMNEITVTRAVLLLLLGLSSVLAAGGEKNRTSVTDPLQRVMLEFNLYQVQTEGEEGGKSDSDYFVTRTRWSH